MGSGNFFLFYVLYILISLKSKSNMGSHLTQKPKIGQKGLREKGIGRGTIIQSFVGNVFYSSKVSVSYYCIRNLKKNKIYHVSIYCIIWCAKSGFSLSICTLCSHLTYFNYLHRKLSQRPVQLKTEQLLSILYTRRILQLLLLLLFLFFSVLSL